MKFHQVVARIEPIERRLRDFVADWLDNEGYGPDPGFDAATGHTVAAKIEQDLPLSESEAKLVEKVLIDSWEHFVEHEFF